MRVFLLAALLLAAGCKPAPETAANAGAPDQPGWSGPRAAEAEAEVEVEAAGVLDRSHAGEAAPGAEFEDPDGEPASFADFEGKPLLVNLWATWCPPCVAEMPTLDALAAREGERLQVLALSQDLNGRSKVGVFFGKQRFSRLEPYLDAQQAVMAELKVGTLPTTILYDARGREVWRMAGMEDWQASRAAALIAEAYPPPAP